MPVLVRAAHAVGEGEEGVSGGDERAPLGGLLYRHPTRLIWPAPTPPWPLPWRGMALSFTTRATRQAEEQIFHLLLSQVRFG